MSVLALKATVSLSTILREGGIRLPSLKPLRVGLAAVFSVLCRVFCPTFRSGKKVVEGKVATMLDYHLLDVTKGSK